MLLFKKNQTCVCPLNMPLCSHATFILRASPINSHSEIIFSRGFEAVTCGTHISSFHTIVPRAPILSLDESTTCLHFRGSHWHLLRHKSAPGGYKVTFQVNPVLMRQCDTECKDYFAISQDRCMYSVPVHSGSLYRSTSLKTKVPYAY